MEYIVDLTKVEKPVLIQIIYKLLEELEEAGYGEEEPIDT